MKKIILSLALLFCMGCAFGQEADKLIAKYKAMEGSRPRESQNGDS